MTTTRPVKLKHAICRAVASLATIACCSFAAESSVSKPVLLYSRYFNAAGESRYQPDGTFKEVLNRLRGEFDVRVHNEPLTAQSLAGVNIVLIANPSDRAVGSNPPPKHVSAEDIGALAQFVEQGGGLMVMGNQENHNLEVHDVNRLLARFGLQFTNLYTDVKSLEVPKETPILGGLRWGYYTGNLVLIEPNHAAKPRSLISNDSKPPLNGSRNQSGSLLAVSEPGRGRVIVVTDCGWITDDVLAGRGVSGVVVKDDDNWEICRRLVHWASGR
jgi:hypothetical protein